MEKREAETSATTPPTVKLGMGYPNNREEESPTPIGWQGLNAEDVTYVSRETSAQREN
jgi:hypothetical protein